MTVKEFCLAHGGEPGRIVDIAPMKDERGNIFTSLKTVDGTAYLAFARNQFAGKDLSVSGVKKLLQNEELDVLEGTSESGKACFTIVEHSDLYEAFDF